MRTKLRHVLLPLLILGSACGGDSPTSPSKIPNVAGVWRGNMTMTSVSGGECVGSLLQSSVGDRSPFTYQIQQNGETLSGTYTDTETGISCAFTGSASNNAFVLNYTSCTVNAFTGIRCSNGNVRDIVIFAGSDSLTVSGNSLSGTSAQSWNVRSSVTGAAVATLTLQQSISATR